MHMDPLLPTIVAAMFGILVVAAAFRCLGQPHVVGYLAAGVLLGPDCLAVFTDVPTLTRMGEFGVILLLFFVGMEVDIRRLARSWKVPVIGTVIQVAGSVACIALLGEALGWPWRRSVLLGFVISLSSTTLVMSMLRGWKESETPAALDAIGILLVQDVAVVAMVIALGLMGGGPVDYGALALQGIGAGAIFWLVATLLRTEVVTLPFGEFLKAHEESEVFAAFLICFGFATVTAFFGLSTALGAFVAGLVVSAAKETHWIHESLDPFRVLFVALFFVSVGMLMDLGFLMEHWGALLVLTAMALGVNTLLNAAILRALGRGWCTSFYVGALLSQIGEFSFVLASLGKQQELIGDFAYQGTIAVIALTIVLNPLWVGLFRSKRGDSARCAVMG